jgi:multiple sugar transport system substrate-binding protein
MTTGYWRRLMQVLAVALLVSLLGLAPGRADAKTLGFVTFPGPGTHAEFTQRLVEEWAKANGHVIRSQVVPFVQLRDKIMVTMIARDLSVDFYYVDSGPYPLFAHGLAPLNDLMARDKPDLSAIAKPLLDVFTVEGKSHSIPHESDTSLLVYREDLFSDAAERRNFRQRYGRDLAPPKTFDEMMQVAEFFTRKKGEPLAGKPLDDSFYGAALSGRTYISTTRLFQMCLHGYGARSFDANLCPAFNGEGAQKALQFFADLVNKGVAVPGVMTTGTPEIVVLMNEGRAAMSATYPTGIGIGSRPGYRYASAPWYPATTKAWGLGIAEHSKNKEEVWSLIKFMIQKDTQMRFGLRSAGFGAEPTRSDVLRDPKLQAERPTLTAMAETHERSIPQTNIPEMAYVWDIQAEPIADVLVNKMTVKAALDKAVGKVYKLLQDAGYYEGKPRCPNVP